MRKVIVGMNYKGNVTPVCSKCYAHAGKINSNYCCYWGNEE